MSSMSFGESDEAHQEVGVTRTAWIYFHPMVDRLLEQGIDSDVPVDFYASDHWAAKANSTDRLTVANYQAIRRLGDHHLVDLVHFRDAAPRLSEILHGYDNVVVNIISAPKVAEFLCSLSRAEGYPSRTARLIFGTEMTPFRMLKQGAIGQREIDMLYYDNLLLRHTGKTDAPVYLDTEARRTSILEFPLGVDTKVLRADPSTDRNLITFVKGPEGRTTKNNDAIDEIVGLLQAHRAYAQFEIHVVEPPYTSLEFWEVMRRSAFLVFTSRGETFSYVVNDAMSHGVVTFIRGEMFATKIPEFAADSYPDHAIRYSSYRDLMRLLDAHILDQNTWQAASIRARAGVERRFSIESVAAAWDRVLTCAPVPRRSLLIVDGRVRGSSRRDAVELSAAAGAALVLFDRNRGWTARPNGAHSEHLEEEGVTILRHYVSEIDGKLWRYDRLASRGALLAKERPEVTAEFLSLVCRLNEITDVKIDQSLEGSVIAAAADRWAESADPYGIFGRRVELIDLAAT